MDQRGIVAGQQVLRVAPTRAEAGVPNMEKAQTWWAIFGQPGLPADIARKMNAAIVAKKPAGLSHVECAALGLIGLTALVSIEDTIKLKGGETLPAKMTLTIDGLALAVTIDGRISLE